MKIRTTILSRMVIGAIAAGALLFAGNLAAAKAAPSPKASPEGAAKESKAAGAKLSAKDKAFMMKAAKGGMMEVEWGKVASANSQNADVKKFGNRMVTDHSKANGELEALAKEEGVKLPGAKKAGKWKSDKDYMDMMVKDHEEDLAEFQKEAKEGTDADLKKFADKGAKMVKKHLEMAKEIQGKVK
jgi:putative membrane protein